jgi:hypothetical protein
MKDPNNAKPKRLLRNTRLAICDDKKRNQENRGWKEIKKQTDKRGERERERNTSPFQCRPVQYAIAKYYGLLSNLSVTIGRWFRVIRP